MQIDDKIVKVACAAFSKVYGAGLSQVDGRWKDNTDAALRAALTAALAEREPVAVGVKPHIQHRLAVLKRAAELDGGDYAGDFCWEPSGNQLEDDARTVAIVLAGYSWTVDVKTGRIAGLVGGDQGYAATNLEVDEATRSALVATPPAERVLLRVKDARTIMSVVEEFYLRHELSPDEDRAFLNLCNAGNFGRPVRDGSHRAALAAVEGRKNG